MIYLDTSVALAALLAEDRKPRAALWAEPLVSSRLLEYELWTRLNVRELGESHRAAAHELLSRISFVELAPAVLRRALEPFPLPVRTLDALHLASFAFLQAQGIEVTLATFDERMKKVARKMGLPTFAA